MAIAIIAQYSCLHELYMWLNLRTAEPGEFEPYKNLLTCYFGLLKTHYIHVQLIQEGLYTFPSRYCSDTIDIPCHDLDFHALNAHHVRHVGFTGLQNYPTRGALKSTNKISLITCHLKQLHPFNIE